MNKTLTINLSGIVFHIDENAYNVFNTYIESIRRHFASSEGKDEIMQDIEARIAEMFQSRVGESKQVITMHDVEEVTAAMGKPEQFGDEEKTGYETSSLDEKSFEGKIKRRLFRDPDDKILGGVCSGISAYFDIEPIWMRLALAISIIFYGTGFLLYIILWIIIPKAKTTADKLMMRGEKVTISNIEKNVREEFDELKNKVKDFSGEATEKIRTKDYSGFTGFLRRFFDGLGEILGFILKAIGKILAFFFVIIGLAVFIVCLLAFLTVAGVSAVKLPGVALSFFTSSGLLFWALVAVLLIVGIPFLLLFYHGFRILFNIQHKSKVVNMTAGGLWIAGVLIALITGASIAKKYSDHGTVRQELNIMQPASDTLFVSMKANSIDMDEEDTGPFSGWYMQSDTTTTVPGNGNVSITRRTGVTVTGKGPFSEWFMSSDDTSSTIAGPVHVDIKRSGGNNFELTKVVSSRGASRKKAIENADGVMMSYTQTDNKLILDNHFLLSKNHGFGFQNVKFVIGLPLGKVIHVSKDMRDILYDVKNVHDMLDYDMAGHNWKMTENGLTCLDCSDADKSSYDDEGIHFGGHDKDSVIIDKHGVVIKKHGKDVIRIDNNGVRVKDDEEN